MVDSLQGKAPWDSYGKLEPQDLGMMNNSSDSKRLSHGKLSVINFTKLHENHTACNRSVHIVYAFRRASKGPRALASLFPPSLSLSRSLAERRLRR